MRGVSNGHDDVAGRPTATAGMPLTAQPDGLPLFDAGGDCDVQRLPGRQGDAHRPAMGNRRELNRDRHADIFPAGRLGAPTGATGAEQFGENVRIDGTAMGRRPPSPKVEAEVAEVAGTAPRLAAKAETFELGRARLALGVDLAAIEGFALFVVAKDLIGRADFRETLFRLRLLALIGVVFLGELPKGGFDLRLARGLGYAKNVVGVTHLGAHPSAQAFLKSAKANVSLAHLALPAAVRKINGWKRRLARRRGSR